MATEYTDERNHVHRGYEMRYGIGGDAASGFYVAKQRMRLATQGALENVPIDGVASGRFATMDEAFDAAKRRLEQAIDRKIDG